MRRRTRRSETDILRLLGEVSAAGLGQSPWSQALAATSAFFESAGAALFDVDRSTGRVPEISTFGLGETQGDYAERMNAINPRMLRALAQPGCHVAHDYAVLPEEAMRRHEFYDWLGRECGVRYHIGARMVDDADLSSFFSVEFAPHHGHAEQDEIELFQLLSRHVANAWRLSRGLSDLAAKKGLHEALEESAPWGVLGLDSGGRVRMVSRRARVILAREDGLAIRKERLRALRAAEDRGLDLLISKVARSIDVGGFHAGGALAVPRQRGGPPYVLRVMPVVNGLALPRASIAILVLLCDPECTLPPIEELRAIFGLTEREADLASLLAGGWALKQAAQRLAIAHNTARVHLANITAKTGTRSQTELVALLGNLPRARTL
jgi:DNA-binding CsgD family transcriptional regulator